jgi:hypothetical protein
MENIASDAAVALKCLEITESPLAWGVRQLEAAMCASRRAILFSLFIFALLASACDPGYKYQPVDANGQQLPTWSEKVEGVRFSTRPYSELIGSGNTIRYLDITNESDKEVVVLGGHLLTNGRKIEAHIIDDPPNREARTVPAGESKSVFLLWEFGGPASDVLGPDITWVWRVRIGETEHSLRVPMQRQR